MISPYHIREICESHGGKVSGRTFQPETWVQYKKVRINLKTLEQMDDTGFSASALRMIQDAVKMYREELLDKWKEYHGEEKI